MRVARWGYDWLKSIIVALLIWFVVRAVLIEAFRIPSGSMEKTLLVGDFLFVTKTLYGAEVPFTRVHFPPLREPRFGEIVVFRSVEGNFNVVKRIIGVPDDTLAMVHGKVIRNGNELSEPYVLHTDSGRSADAGERLRMRTWQLPHLVRPSRADYSPDLQDWGPIIVPRDSFFVMGDNRDNSLDSRYWGFLPRDHIRGKPLVIYYSYEGDTWRPLPFLTAIRWNRIGKLLQ